jgi:hypothetical protein
MTAWRVLESAGYKVRSSDILTGTDFLKECEPWVGSIITNPPYKLRNRFIATALLLATEQVAILLPIPRLGGQARYKYL